MDKKKIKISSLIFWIFWIIFFVGIILTNNEKTSYPTSEYWVAKDYHRVYEKHSGEIVDYIEKDENCKISGDLITVSKRPKTFTLGCIISIISSLVIIGYIWDWIEDKYHEWKYKK